MSKTYYEEGVWDCEEREFMDGSTELVYMNMFGNPITGVVETEDGDIEVENGFVV